jgi:hypothetical protein
MHYNKLFFEFLSLGGETTNAINLDVFYEIHEDYWIKFNNVLDTLQPNKNKLVILTNDEYDLLFEYTYDINVVFGPAISQMMRTYIEKKISDKFNCPYRINFCKGNFDNGVGFSKDDSAMGFSEFNYEIESRTGFEKIFDTGNSQYLNMDYLYDILYNDYLDTVRRIKKVIKKIELSHDEKIVIDHVQNSEIIHLMNNFKIKVMKVLPYELIYNTPIVGIIRIIGHYCLVLIKNTRGDSLKNPKISVNNIVTGAYIIFANW